MKRIAKVTYMRISQIEVVIQRNEVHVAFTLYDKSGFYGNVTEPIFDVSLEGLQFSLTF